VGGELYSLYNEPNIMKDIKIIRLGWAGHIIRMEEERITNSFQTETCTPQDQWENQESDGQMWSRGMHYSCWG